MPSFDESPVPGTTPADLDPALTRRFMRGDAEVTDDTLRKLRIIANDPNDIPRITVSGVLLSTRTPQNWLSYAEIQAVAYVGDQRDRRDQIDARDIGGTLDEQVAGVLHFVRRNIKIPALKHTMRVEYPPYNERALFEAIVNAVAHRDYSMAGARIRLHLFSDRLELSIPGALSNTLTPDSLYLRQYNRNELIVSLLARCPVPEEGGFGRSFLMDRRGDGVPIILNESRKISGKTPEYTLIDESELRLVIWASLPPNKP
jgi:predicted HTH transcriptional regulator